MINTIPMPPPEPQPAELTPARAAQIRIGAAIRASYLSSTMRLVLWTATDMAAEAVDDGRPFSISIEELSEQTGLLGSLVALKVADLIRQGWFVRSEDGRLLPTVPEFKGRS